MRAHIAFSGCSRQGAADAQCGVLSITDTYSSMCSSAASSEQNTHWQASLSASVLLSRPSSRCHQGKGLRQYPPPLHVQRVMHLTCVHRPVYVFLCMRLDLCLVCVCCFSRSIDSSHLRWGCTSVSVHSSCFAGFVASVLSGWLRPIVCSMCALFPSYTDIPRGYGSVYAWWWKEGAAIVVACIAGNKNGDTSVSAVKQREGANAGCSSTARPASDAPTTAMRPLMHARRRRTVAPWMAERWTRGSLRLCVCCVRVLVAVGGCAVWGDRQWAQGDQRTPPGGGCVHVHRPGGDTRAHHSPAASAPSSSSHAQVCRAEKGPLREDCHHKDSVCGRAHVRRSAASAHAAQSEHARGRADGAQDTQDPHVGCTSECCAVSVHSRRRTRIIAHTHMHHRRLELKQRLQRRDSRGRGECSHTHCLHAAADGVQLRVLADGLAVSAQAALQPLLSSLLHASTLALLLCVCSGCSGGCVCGAPARVMGVGGTAVRGTPVLVCAEGVSREIVPTASVHSVDTLLSFVCSLCASSSAQSEDAMCGGMMRCERRPMPSSSPSPTSSACSAMHARRSS